MSVTVKWTAKDEDGDTLVRETTTVLQGEWADCEDNAEAAVQEVSEDWFRTADFDVVIITVSSPQSIAGRYEVSLRTVVKASVRALPTTPTTGEAE